MPFTGVPDIAVVSDSVARITGVSLAAGAEGTIGLFGSGADIELPRRLNWGPYGNIDLAEAIEVIITPEIPLTVFKTSPPFLATIGNYNQHALRSQTLVARMTRNAPAQNIDDDTETVIDFTTTVFATDIALIDLAANAFVAIQAGIWRITANVEWRATIAADGTFQTTVLVNGAGVNTTRSTSNSSNAAAVVRSNTIATLLELDEGDLVTFEANQVSGAQQSLGPAEATFELESGQDPAETGDLEIYLRYH